LVAGDATKRSGRPVIEYSTRTTLARKSFLLREKHPAHLVGRLDKRRLIS
jgi:hypothetical protein